MASAVLHRIRSPVLVGRYKWTLIFLSALLLGGIVLGVLAALEIVDTDIMHDTLRTLFGLFALGYSGWGLWYAVAFNAHLSGMDGGSSDIAATTCGTCRKGCCGSHGLFFWCCRSSSPASSGSSSQTGPHRRPARVATPTISLVRARRKLRGTVHTMIGAGLVWAGMYVWAMWTRFLVAWQFLMVDWTARGCEAAVLAALIFALFSGAW